MNKSRENTFKKYLLSMQEETERFCEKIRATFKRLNATEIFRHDAMVAILMLSCLVSIEPEESGCDEGRTIRPMW